MAHVGMVLAAQHLHEPVHQALSQWRQSGAESSLLQQLTWFQQIQRQRHTTPHQTTNQLLLDALHHLSHHHTQEATLLRRRFLDNELVHKIANELNLAESTFYRKQQEAIERLVAVIVVQEQQAQTEYKRLIRQRLEAPTYSYLIGIEESLHQLLALLTAPGPPWLIAITGMGGLGKTALADALARLLLEQQPPVALGWVTARQSFFNLGGSIQTVARPAVTQEALIEALYTQLIGEHPPIYGQEEMLAALTQRLPETPHVIFIDNLESLLDLATLLPTLRRLVNPTRFVLTTRDSLYAEADIYHFGVPELPAANALTLVRQEARLRNLAWMVDATDADLRSIYQTVGGNPLALRLVVGQLHVHPLPTVLADLQGARTAKAQALYTFLYRRAWDHLNELERNTLLIMPMVSEQGGDLALLAGISQLDPADLLTALDTLVLRNLVDSHGDLHTRRYTIHSLTRTFLQQQVIQWQTTPV